MLNSLKTKQDKMTKAYEYQKNWNEDDIQQIPSSSFAYKRPKEFCKITQSLSELKTARIIFQLAQNGIFELPNNQQNEEMTIFFEESIPEWNNVVVKMGKFFFRLRVVDKMRKYDLQSSNYLGYGAHGEIYKYQHFEEQIAIKMIRHNYLTMIELQKIIKKKQQEQQDKTKSEIRFLQTVKYQLKDIIIPYRIIRQNEINELKNQLSKEKQKFIRTINDAIKEYCILKFCSALRIGPHFFNDNFDLLLYDDYICFFMEKCQTNLYNFELRKSNNIDSDLRDNLVLMHRFNLVHNDIKPMNMLYSHKYRKFVFGDFGLSKFLEQKVGGKLVKTYHFMGTLKYTCPQMVEIYRKEKPKYIDYYENDWYALEQTLKEISDIQTASKKQEQVHRRLFNYTEDQLILHFGYFGQLSRFHQVKLNHIKLKILQNDTDYLKQNIELIKYFRKQLLLYIQSIPLDYKLSALLAFALKPNNSRFEQLIHNQKNIKSKLKILNQTTKIESISYSQNTASARIVNFINFFCNFSPFQFENIIKIQNYVPILISHFKSFKNITDEDLKRIKDIQKLIQLKIQGKFTKNLYSKYVNKCLGNIFSLIIDYVSLKQQQKNSKYLIFNALLKAMTFSLEILHIFPLIRFVEQYQIGFYHKLNLIFSFTMYQSIQNDCQNFGNIHISQYFKIEQIKTQQKSFILQKMQILVLLLLRLREKHRKKKLYLELKYADTYWKNYRELIKQIKEILLSIFSKQYFVQKLNIIFMQLQQYQFVPNEIRKSSIFLKHQVRKPFQLTYEQNDYDYIQHLNLLKKEQIFRRQLERGQEVYFIS